ncbi:uncharacterized protein LOC130937911 [Arachis stenosperma]|uniref:uncharacterized protein LOC130937911 n=1 Tax=Arachis stenosperma TaxID=217475 RepID=UPI0025AC07EC|nr:uncharacterized protein LOC130937911 [Arachis stenosperma]
MAQDSEKKFHSIMDKLFHTPKSPSSSSGMQLLSGKKRPYSTSLGTMELNLRGDAAEVPLSLSATVGATEGALCRPWDRGDFMRRLATFKSISWFAKPKVVSAVNCARRGWINVDIDTIACEACGARLLFSTPASWNQQQVEKAARVFSLKLDNGHKLLCPWIDNACSETLARFPPTAPPVLVDNFRERCSSLLQLSALPHVSSSVIEHMHSPLLEDFLGQSLFLDFGNGSARNSDIEIISSQEELKLYYQSQKLISLCGWNLRPLPYIVDCKDTKEQSVRSTTILDRSQVVADNNNFETNENLKDSNGEQLDPNSAVLECTLCGATVGLWAFSTIPRPVESLRIVGYAEVNCKNDSVIQDRQGQGVNKVSDIATSSKDMSSSLNMTIAGGPPPTKQNFKAIISLPVIGQNLRARLSYDSDFRDHVFVDGDGMQSDSRKKIRIQENPDDNIVDASNKQIVPMSSEIRESSHDQTGSKASARDPVVDNVTESTHHEGDGLNSSAAGDPSSLQKNSDGVVNRLSNYGAKDNVENFVNREDQHCSLERDMKSTTADKTMEFNPIRHHRYFCPWIASIDDMEPGWKQTLSALFHQQNHFPHSPNKSPTSMLIVKVDDPVSSVKKLFLSPSTRRKLAHIASQNTEHR